MNIWFTSDTHYQHKAAALRFRGFSSVEEMDELLIQNFNSLVRKNDLVYHLGDFAWKDPKAIRDRLNGQIYLIRGNHDSNRVLTAGFVWVRDTHTLKFKSEGIKIFLSHYPHRAWDSSFHGSWHLHGHCHGNMEPLGRSRDVGVDAWDFKPVHFDQLREWMENQPITNHH